MPSTAPADSAVTAPAAVVLDPGFRALVEHPTALDVRGHTLQVARFAGWIGTVRGRALSVRVYVDGRRLLTAPVSNPRQDVIDALGAPGGVEIAAGFDFFLDLPPGLARPIPVDLELCDGVNTIRSPTYTINPEVDISGLETHVAHPPAMNRLAQALTGVGVEFGALHLPMAVDPEKATVRYADRHSKEASLVLFSELEAGYADRFVDVDYQIDLDRDDLSRFEPEHLDFFIANGVIEHLVNPVRFLVNLHRVMKPGAKLLLGVPDRDFTFDTFRPLTPLEHLWGEYEADVTELTDAHLEEAVRGSSGGVLPDDLDARRGLLDDHRRRSVHVHVWDQRSFDELLETTIDRAALSFSVVERVASRDALGNCVYFIERR